MGHEDSCVSGILSPLEALDNEQVRARGMVESAGGKPAFALPIKFSAAPQRAGEPPALGAHNDEVLAALGLKRSAKAAAPQAGATKMMLGG